MTVQEVAKRVMRDKGLSQGEVANRCGATGQSMVGMWMQGKSMNVDKLLKILNVCGYEIIVRDKNGKGNMYRISEESGEDIVTDGIPASGTDTIRELVKQFVAEELKASKE